MMYLHFLVFGNVTSQMRQLTTPLPTELEFKKQGYLLIMKRLQATILLANRQQITCRVVLTLLVSMLQASNKSNKTTLALIQEVY